MFGKKTEAPFPREEFRDRLSQLVSAASKAGMSDLQIAKELEAQAKPLRMLHESQLLMTPVASVGSDTLTNRQIARMRGTR